MTIQGYPVSLSGCLARTPDSLEGQLRLLECFASLFPVFANGPHEGLRTIHFNFRNHSVEYDMAKTQLAKQRTGTPAPLLTETEAAQYLSLTKRALQAWRCQGRGPRFVKVSARAIRYRLSDLETWVEGRLRRSTSDSGAA